MPFHQFDFFNQRDEYVYDPTYVYIDTNTCRLTRRNTLGNWALDGLFYESTVTFPEWTGTAIRQLTSISWRTTTPEDSEVGFQVSTDGGTVYQYYDGADWQTASVTDWTSIDDFATGIPQLSTTRLIVKMRMTPSSDNARTPLVELVNIYYEGVWNYFEDLKRTLKHEIDTNLEIDIAWGRKIVASTTSIPLDTQWEILSVETAYDLTNDPYRATNLYQSYSSTPTPTVTLTSAISNATLEVNMKTRCPVFLSADENFIISEIPAIVLELPSAVEDDYQAKNLFEYEPIRQSNLFRRREKSIPIQSTIILRCLSDREVDSLAMLDGVSDIFEGEGVVRSLATGEDFFVLTFQPLRANDVISTGLYDKATQMLVIGNQELTRYTEVPGAVDISITLSGATVFTEEEHPITNSALPKSDICSTIAPEEEVIS